MPQYDKRRKLHVPIEFNPNETLQALPVSERLTLVLATDGKANVELNGVMITIIAPCAICLSDSDTIAVIENSRLYAQSFSLNPSFMNNRTTFKQIKSNINPQSECEYTRDVMGLFSKRCTGYNGILDLPPQHYINVFEWLSIIGNEMSAQSDGRWTCRVRAHFLRILNLLDDLYANKGAYQSDKQSSPVDFIMEYIHVHYMDEITLTKLCSLTHINRTTLNKLFKQRTGQTIIDYLLTYRLRVAKELMAHTGLTLDEIARSTGFGYDTYLIRQFTNKTGMTPSQYGEEVRSRAKIVIDEAK